MTATDKPIALSLAAHACTQGTNEAWPRLLSLTVCIQDGDTGLITACIYGHRKVVEVLLTAKASKDFRRKVSDRHSH